MIRRIHFCNQLHDSAARPTHFHTLNTPVYGQKKAQDHVLQAALSTTPISFTPACSSVHLFHQNIHPSCHCTSSQNVLHILPLQFLHCGFPAQHHELLQ
eukprot:c33992_g1_i1 orf=1-294(-)